jgi:hypothetical protein
MIAESYGSVSQCCVLKGGEARLPSALARQITGKMEREVDAGLWPSEKKLSHRLQTA